MIPQPKFRKGAVLFAVLLSIVAGLLTRPAQAQSDARPSAQNPSAVGPTATQQQDEPSKLTEGLLELLNENGSSSKKDGISKGSIESARTGESLKRKDQAAGNPLVDIRTKMQRASLMLQQSRNVSTAVEVQTGIVKQLDELIAQLEQQQSTEQSNSTKQRQTQAQSQQQAQMKPDDSRESASKSVRSQSSQPGDGSPDASSTDMTVRTRDPAALQQNVWGHLPARVRSQMQSRMVEEFLPSYRSKIEQYYRELMQEGEKK